VLSTGGSYLLASAVLLSLGNLLVALKWGDKAPPNPWGSRGFEWLTSSPPPKHNFAAPPTLDYSPYDYTLTDEEARARAGQ
jgi:cytochrome c oxidase subunit I